MKELGERGMGGGGCGGVTIMSLMHCHGGSISDDDDCCNGGLSRRFHTRAEMMSLCRRVQYRSQQ